MAFSVTLKNLGAFAAASNLQLFLYKTSDNSLLNSGGDTGVDASSIGSFAWTVAEDRPAEQMLAKIYEGATATAANIIIDSVLNVGFTEIGQEAVELDSSSLIRFVTEDTGETAAADGSVAKIAQGSAGGGDATLANQNTIIGLINAYLSSITAVAQATPGTIAGFPSTLSVGDSYTDAVNNAITVTLVDDEDNPVDTWGDYDVNHAGFTPTLVISGSGGKVTATVTYDTDHFLVEIPSSESLRASPGTATMQFVLKWFVDDRLVAQKTIVSGQAVTWIKQI